MSRPPPFAVAVLHACCPLADRDAVLGDVCEEYRALAGSQGDGRAASWLWRQVFGSAPFFLMLRLSRSHFDVSGLAIASGLATVLTVQSVTAGAGILLAGSVVPDGEPWFRAISSVLAFACGGYAAARIGDRSPRYLPAVFGGCCVAISAYFLWPVISIVRASGASAILYHLLLLALIVPSVIAGARTSRVNLRVRRSCSPP